MNTSMTTADQERFDTCTTKDECEALLKELSAPHYVVTTQFKKARSKRVKELRAAFLAPFHEEASRWEPGQKVFFAKGIKSTAMDWNFRTIKGSEKDIKAGDWCRVWGYEPRTKTLWLCRPRTALKRTNVITDCFSINEVARLGISRTELALRAK